MRICMARSVSPRPNAAWAFIWTSLPSARSFWTCTRLSASCWAATLLGSLGFGSLPTRAVPGGGQLLQLELLGVERVEQFGRFLLHPEVVSLKREPLGGLKFPAGEFVSGLVEQLPTRGVSAGRDGGLAVGAAGARDARIASADGAGGANTTDRADGAERTYRTRTDR